MIDDNGTIQLSRPVTFIRSGTLFAQRWSDLQSTPKKVLHCNMYKLVWTSTLQAGATFHVKLSEIRGSAAPVKNCKTKDKDSVYPFMCLCLDCAFTMPVAVAVSN